MLESLRFAMGEVTIRRGIKRRAQKRKGAPETGGTATFGEGSRCTAVSSIKTRRLFSGSSLSRKWSPCALKRVSEGV